MKKDCILERKGLMKISKIVIALLIVVTLISSSTVSLETTLKNISKIRKNIYEKITEEISNGLAPIKKEIKGSSNIKSINIEQSMIEPLDEFMYGYRADSEPESLIYFDLCDPGTIDEIGPTQSNNFIAGATCYPNSRWIGCEYGIGKLWEIDRFTGEMFLIGGGGENLNALAYDPIYNKMYGSGDNNYLYKVDPDTGQQEQIGPFGSDVEYMIGMSFDSDGILYGWDLGTDCLWTIDTETGEAEEIGPLGIDLNYAQDGNFDRQTDTLYLTAYTSTGQLYQCDKETGQCTIIGEFEDGAEITASMFFQCSFCCEHDIALKKIDYPETGPVIPNMDMQITVKNQGNNTETFDTKMEVMKNVTGPIIMEENFEGDFPPDGWTTDYWTQSYTNESGGIAPEARVYNIDQYNGGQHYDNFIQSGYINCSGYNRIKLRFRWASSGIDYPYYCTIYVMVRKSSGSPWKYVTPWDGSLEGNQTAKLWETEWIGFDGPLGKELQIRWEYIGHYSYYDYFWLDDISIEACSDCLEYSENIENIVLEPGKYKKIDFPEWTPDDWQNESYENTWIKYLVNAKVDFSGDHNPRNDEKKKWIDLYFGYFHDVGCSNISSPISGPAQIFPVIGHVKNFGQYNESDFNTYIEIAELDIDKPVELINQDFSSSTFPPDGWTKTHNNWMYSTTNYAGGSNGEARFYYYPYSTDIFRFYTPALDTSEYEAIEIEFKHYIDHYTTPYTLKLETSEDGVTWDTLWKIEPTENIGPEAINLLTDKNISTNMYFSWTFEGYSFNIDNWYIDDIIIKGYSTLEPEYEDNFNISIIEPGEDLEINFSEWTSDFLDEEVTGQKLYVTKCWTNLVDPEDKNPDNDLYKKLITLDFFHDVRIKNITSPSSPCNAYDKTIKFETPMPEIYIQPGTEDIDVIVENNGTFPEFNLTCYAEIWEFLTDPHNGSLVYWDEIIDIDLDEPVGGTKLLNFDDFTFVEEGVYGLYLDLPLGIDDYPENNHKNLTIGVDDTAPVSWVEEIDPPEPDGENGWYISDVKVTICAEDPEIAPGIPGSGICGIYVSKNGYYPDFYPEDCITVIIGEDGDDILVDFWAIDCVGNVGSGGSFTIDIDHTVPEVSLSYEVLGWSPMEGWEFAFTAVATDAMSGMDRVEFYLNNELQETIYGSGPEYQWTLRYNPLPYAIFRATAYDKAGVYDSDEIIDPKTSSHSFSKSIQIFNIFSNPQNHLKNLQLSTSNSYVLKIPPFR